MGNVNLSRQDSNETDDNFTGLTEIELPPAPSVDLGREHKRARSGICRTEPLIRFSESIERYLKPRQEEQFEIATDHTATNVDCSISSSTCDSLLGQTFIRRPLQPLSDAALNRERVRNDTSREPSSPVPETLNPQHALQNNIEAFLHHQLPEGRGPRREDIVTVLANARSSITDEPSQSLRSSPFRQYHAPGIFLSPPTPDITRGRGRSSPFLHLPQPDQGLPTINPQNLAHPSPGP